MLATLCQGFRALKDRKIEAIVSAKAEAATWQGHTDAAPSSMPSTTWCAVQSAKSCDPKASCNGALSNTSMGAARLSGLPTAVALRQPFPACACSRVQHQSPVVTSRATQETQMGRE
jgi:hypothetical protein